MTTRQLFSVILFFSLLGLAATEADDPDMWWHLRTGEMILQGGIPRVDTFSFTLQGSPWITHEWLSQVVLWLVYAAGGFAGLIVVFTLIIALSLWLVYLRCEGRPYIAGFVIVLAGATSSGLWGSRPQMFNFLLLALYIFLMEGFRARSRAARAAGTSEPLRGLWLFVPLTALWANFHSGYLFGVVLLATYAVGEAFQRRLVPSDERPLEWGQIRTLAAATVGSFLAALLNPNGYELWLYPFFTLGSSIMQQRIVEWFSPDFHNPYNWPFALMLALGVFGFAWSRPRPTWTDMLLFLGTGFAGLVSVRHIPLFALVAAPILCRSLLGIAEGTSLHPLLSGTEASAPPPRRLALLNALVAALVILFPLVRIAGKVAENPDIITKRYPVAAVDFLEEAGLKEARGFNSYGWGGYLIWRGLPVFVDGRADVYGDFLTTYFQVADLRETWREPLETFEIDYVLMEPSARLSTMLLSSPQWREVYRDKIAIIFVRND